MLHIWEDCRKRGVRRSVSRQHYTRVVARKTLLQCIARIFTFAAAESLSSCDKAWQCHTAVSMSSHGSAIAFHCSSRQFHVLPWHSTPSGLPWRVPWYWRDLPWQVPLHVLWVQRCHVLLQRHGRRRPLGMPSQPVARSPWLVPRAVMVTHGSPWSLP